MSAFVPTRLEDVTPALIVKARRLMTARTSLRDTAAILGVCPSSVLDRALWQHIDRPYERMIYAQPKERT